MQTTRFRVWLRPLVRKRDLTPGVWAGVRLVQPPTPYGDDAVDVIVEDNGSDLRLLVRERLEVFAGLMELRPGDQ